MCGETAIRCSDVDLCSVIFLHYLEHFNLIFLEADINVFHFRLNYRRLLAHLSRRLIGELIVYEGIRRPSIFKHLL